MPKNTYFVTTLALGLMATLFAVIGSAEAYGGDDCDASIGNRVWYDNNQNWLQDADEPGIEDVTVKMYNGNDVDYRDTNSKGRYEFDGLCEGTYDFVVDTRTLPDGCVPVADRDGDLDHKAEQYVDEGDKATKIDFGYYCPSNASMKTHYAPQTGPGPALIVAVGGAASVAALTLILGRRASSKRAKY